MIHNMAIQLGKKRIATVMAAVALLCGLGVAAGPRAEALEPRTVWFSTEAACKAAVPQYSGSFTSISQGCTYAGSMIFGFHTSSGPWFLVYQTRTY